MHYHFKLQSYDSCGKSNTLGTGSQVHAFGCIPSFGCPPASDILGFKGFQALGPKYGRILGFPVFGGLQGLSCGVLHTLSLNAIGGLPMVVLHHFMASVGHIVWETTIGGHHHSKASNEWWPPHMGLHQMESSHLWVGAQRGHIFLGGELRRSHLRHIFHERC